MHALQPSRAAAAAAADQVCSPAAQHLSQADAAALAECPNYWVPRDVVEGREPAITAAEQIVQQLYRRLVAPQLAPHADAFLGAEYWCQIYERGRGLGFHYDKARAVLSEDERCNTKWQLRCCHRWGALSTNANPRCLLSLSIGCRTSTP